MVHRRRAPAARRYDALFSIAVARKQLKSDIENSLEQIKERLVATNVDPKTTTLRQLMENELRPEVYGMEKCRDRVAACEQADVATMQTSPPVSKRTSPPVERPWSLV